ncbi:MAG: GDP-L-fucose synthase [Candidatus Eremiobacterota bacterium]
MELNSKIYVAGADTLPGKAIIKKLHKKGYKYILAQDGKEPDLTDMKEVSSFFAKNTPEYIFLTAGKSGGISANQKYPAELMIDNLFIECNIIHCAWKYGIKKLLYLASSCSYPKHCEQPMKEDYILTGSLEPTNEAYAVAKIAGIKLCQSYRQQYSANFITGIPANIFGPGDDFSPEDSHVIGSLIRKMDEAKEQNHKKIEIWGTGSPRRDFIFSYDLADACIFLMNTYDHIDPINIGGNSDISISELAVLIKEVTEFKGDICYNTGKPDGMPVKILDSTKLKALGWKPEHSFPSAIKETYRWFLEQK